jgi:hypothetical protein
MSASVRRIWIQLTADRRRFGLLCATVVIGLLFWGRLIVVSQPPRMAVAGGEKNTPSAGAGSKKAVGGGRRTTIDETGADNSAAGASSVDGGRRGNRSPIAVELWATPARDPFVISPRYFPKPAPIVDLHQSASKSQIKPAEEPQQIEARRTAQLQAAVERMKLEAAIQGSLAVINGRKYRVGDLIPAKPGSEVLFKLVEVKQRSVMLECEDRRFEVQMTNPGT